MITRQEQRIVTIPFSQILDPRTGRTRVRLLDTTSPSDETARALQVRLGEDDLEAESGAALTQTTGLDAAALRARYLASP